MSDLPYDDHTFPVPGFVDLRPEVVNRLKPERHSAVEEAALQFLRDNPNLVRGPDMEAAGLPKLLMVNVDLQNCFVLSPIGQHLPKEDCLSVPGAIDDLIRSVEIGYRYTPYIWNWLATMDTHAAHTVHSRFYYVVAETGEPPPPFTPITIEDLESGRIIPIPEAFEEGRMPPLEMAKELWEQYGPDAERPRMWNATIMAWATHAQQGSATQALAAEIWQAMHYWEVVMRRNAIILQKGLQLDSESYGAFQAAIETQDERSFLNWNALQIFLEADRILWGGAQARTHCSLDTLCQLVDFLAEWAPEKLKNVVVLEDCHSNIPDIVGPGGEVVAPFKKWADDEYARLAREHGIRLMKSTDPEFHSFMTGQDF